MKIGEINFFLAKIFLFIRFLIECDQFILLICELFSSFALVLMVVPSVMHFVYYGEFYHS